MEFETSQFELMINGAIFYLMYILSLSAVVQTAISTIKPTVLEWVQTQLEDAGQGDKYIFIFYIFRALVTAIGFFTFWGGTEAASQYLEFLPFTPPEAGIAVGTILLVIMGEEIIHPLIEKLYFAKTTIEELSDVLIDVSEIEPPYINPYSGELAQSDEPLG